MDVIGSVIGGAVGKILLRQKSGEKIELGDLLVSEEDSELVIMQVYDLEYGSQIPSTSIEMIAGLRLEGYGASSDLNIMEPQLRHYVIASVKAVLRVKDGSPSIPKTLPNFLSSLRRIKPEDLRFLTKPDNPIYVGNLRSGSKVLDLPIYLNGPEVLAHHMLISATTGRGKSNLVKVMLWSLMDQDNFGVLVLDSHDEYYGRHGKGLKDHPKAKERLLYYTSAKPPPGGYNLRVNFESIKPVHFNGIAEFSEAQSDAIYNFYTEYKEKWIRNILTNQPLKTTGDEKDEKNKISPRTIAVTQRRLEHLLGVKYTEERGFEYFCNIFSVDEGMSTVGDIVDALEKGKIVIVDTSRIPDIAELLTGVVIVSEVFQRYQYYKHIGELEDKPVVSVVIEEAPRVIGSDVLSRGDNIYSTIAREGRKFKIGLMAITQLTSVIPKTILANMNTKIILGNEMSLEREAIIECAPQDLSDDSRTIASLDKGEAIISSSFTKFAIPVKTPLFEEYIKDKASPASGGRIAYI
ncbi:MAG: ATP-binding protein [Candidatus Odinarchaeum yellowstonii]|uniref:ATP-binding protein n=1 Tax=Odinarchaeota yellowstonii (strain LCB_4) TaxID=1841599 RepID=A0AAF0D2A8_ODILC|nr:MAG: ATP-binding protein [Candidatus Odinarchaeum yellowstonii]